MSVCRQTHRPCELILVDDASDDGTLQMIERLADDMGDQWIKTGTSQRNRGPAATRNLGWDMAAGEYIAFLDADDAWHSRKIELQYAWMKHHPGIALTGHRCFRKRSSAMAAPAVRDGFRAYRVNPLRLLVSNRFLTRSVMMRRDLPYRFDLNKRHSEDYLLWLQIVLNHHGAWYLDTCLAYSFKARFGDGGLSGDIWAMERGELDTFHRLHAEGLMAYPLYLGLINYSMAKHLLRAIYHMISRAHVPPE